MCDQVVPYGELSSDLAGGTARPFIWVTPNVLHDMHDGTVQQGDAWLSQQLPMVMSSPWYQDGGYIIITWDEGTTNSGCCGDAAGGHIATIVVSASVPPGARSSTPVDHAGVLRSIEDLYGLPPLADAASSANGNILSLLAPPASCSAQASSPSPSGKVTRLAGADRDQTAIVVSRSDFPTAGSASVVVLASNAAFPDALAGAPLAVAAHGPLLLTPPSGLTPSVSAEIQRVVPQGATVDVLGGDAALAPAVDSQLQSLGYRVQRLAGADRYATAAAVATAIPDPTGVYEVTGLNFPDGLAAGAAAAGSRGVVLLTDGTAQASATSQWLGEHPGLPRTAVGGPSAAADPAAKAVVGADRYATAAYLAREVFASPDYVGMASAVAFPDALAGGADAGGKGGPLLLVPPCGPLPSSVAGELSSLSGAITTGTLYGGTQAVGDDVLSEVEGDLG